MNTMPIQAAAAGTTGALYPKILTYTAKATGNYVINETNFAGIGVFLPCFIAVGVGTAANVTIQISTDNGTTWKSLYGAGGGVVIADSASTIRIVIATAATDIFLFPIGLP